ncbi:hypothetical protein KUCAC02_013776 [Chaenocephalus aceratus]|uniref:Uncharacterized protein n=1 Tax=Chaenocephalus aceratus TaxID=36190 RepID=A0ACB9WC22_CHAAC|nr:hypothetical protein KUCAC02_013776 [Chaenocephalus aceratus]
MSWGPPGSPVQILGPEQLAWGLVRVFGRGRSDRGAGGLPWPLSHQTQTVLVVWEAATGSSSPESHRCSTVCVLTL